MGQAMRKYGQYFIALAFVSTICGCSTGPLSFFGPGSDVVGGAEPGSNDWWSQQAMLPPGVRQKCYKGKNWPPRPRPTCEPQQFSHTYHSAHYWPLPYVCQDRQFMADIINTQENNGWQEETTMYHRHFQEDQMLNVPGNLHLIDILETTPSRYRTVYVQASYNAEIDNARQANVQQALNELTNGEENIQVVVRRCRGYDRPAGEVKMINDLYNSSIPSPRLAGAAAGGGGGGGGGGAAGALSGIGP